MKLDERKIHRYLIFAILLVQILGLFVDIMDFDASQYASISQEILKDGHWLQIQNRQEAYLDKPPLLFWFSAISFKLFGISNFTYRLPSFLFALLSMYSTYKLTKLFYGQRAGRIASIIIGSVQGIYAITMDVQIDNLLAGAVIFAIWQLSEFLQNHRFKHLILGSIGLAMAMLIKGPIGLMVPALAIGSDLIIHKRSKDFFRWQWLVGIGVIVLLLIPMLYGLFEQFDKHPDLIINGQTGVSGISFYFWSQVTGNAWSQNPGTQLLVFLPWTLILIAALVDRIRFFRKGTKYSEYMSIAGLILPFIALSLFGRQISPYFLVVFPLAAMLSGSFLDKLREKPYKILKNVQFILLFLLWILAFMLLFYIFTPTNIVVVIFSIAIFALMIWGLTKLPKIQVLVIVTTMTAIGVNLVLSGHFYPQLLKYQSTTVVGRWLKAHPKERAHFACYRVHTPAVDFYAGQFCPSRDSVTELSQNDRFLYTDEAGLLALKKRDIPFVVMKTFEDFPVTRLSLSFLDPKQRPEVIGHKYLVAIYPKD